jgi:hypothetical protein
VEGGVSGISGRALRGAETERPGHNGPKLPRVPPKLEFAAEKLGLLLEKLQEDAPKLPLLLAKLKEDAEKLDFLLGKLK